MDALDVVELIELFERSCLEVYVDGGWAVDAILGVQTRAHDDLDIAIPHSHVPRLRSLLSARGFEQQPRADSWECNFVLADARGRRVDVHAYTLDEAGRNVGGVPYEASYLSGSGTIAGVIVRCINPEALVSFHTGYEVDAQDYHDVRLLCAHLGMPLPEEFAKFVG